MTRAIRRGVMVAILGFAAVAVPVSSAQARWSEPLKSPFRRPVLQRARTPYACKPAPPAPRTLDLEGFYDRPGGVGFNQRKYDAYVALQKPVADYKVGLMAATDAYQKTGSSAAARCAVRWIAAWASADALNAPKGDLAGQNERVWTLAATASSYLAVREKASPSEAKVIRSWIRRSAAGVMQAYGAGKVIPWANNMMAWSGYAVAASGIAVNDTRMLEYSVRNARLVFGEIRNGYMPRELQRADRALYYHAYALIPLTYMAELLLPNGFDLYREGGASFEMVAVNIAEGFENPDMFAVIAGVRQTQLDKCGINAWALPWSWRRADRPQFSALAGRCNGYISMPEIGGNPRELYRG